MGRSAWLGLALSVVGCKDEGAAGGDVLARQAIGPEGGEIEGGGLVLTIPANALTAETEIEIRTDGTRLGALDFTQAGETLAVFPDALVLRLPATAHFPTAPDEPAVLFEQDGLTVAAPGDTAYVNELGLVGISQIGSLRAAATMPMLGRTPDDAGTPFHDLAHLQLDVTEIPDLYISLTIYDREQAYTTPLNGNGDGECGFLLENLTGGSLAGGCSEGQVTAVVRTTSQLVGFDLVPFLSGKMETPVTVGMVAGGSDLAYHLGFFSFNTGPCFNETCSGVGVCEDTGSGGVCNCQDGFAADGLTCVCVPQCEGRVCGFDGCGDQCQPGCGPEEFCDEEQGSCVPNGGPEDTGTDDPDSGDTMPSESSGMPDPTTSTSGGSSSGGDPTTSGSSGSTM